jgi:hypothetical protein
MSDLDKRLTDELRLFNHDAAADRMDALRSAVEAVLALHLLVDGKYCLGCGSDGGNWMERYPCPTRVAITATLEDYEVIR